MLTRKELESLGVTDDELSKQVREIFGVDPKLAARNDDDPLTRIVRHNWLREVQKAGLPTVHVGGEPIGSFGENDPETHFGPTGRPKGAG